MIRFTLPAGFVKSIKITLMAGAVNMYGMKIQNFGTETFNSYPRLGCRLEYNDEICVRGTWPKGVTWIRLPQDRDQYQAVVKVVINLLVA